MPKGGSDKSSFSAWVESFPIVGVIPGLPEVIRFYLVRPGGLLHRCPRCAQWVEVLYRTHEVQCAQGDFSIRPAIVCPNTKCHAQYLVENGKLVWVTEQGGA